MKTGKLLVFIALSLSLVAIIVSCNSGSGNGPVIGFTPAEPTTKIPAIGDTCDIKVIANGDWTIRDGNMLNATTNLSSGSAGTTALQIFIGPNASKTATRKISVRFTLVTGDSTQGFITWRAIQDTIAK